MRPVGVVLDLGYLDKFHRREIARVTVAEVGRALEKNGARACGEVILRAVGNAPSFKSALGFLVAISQLVDPGRRKRMRPVASDRMGRRRNIDVPTSSDRSVCVAGKTPRLQRVLIEV